MGGITKLLLAIMLVMLGATCALASTQPKGHVEGVYWQSDAYYLTGWTCVEGVNQSLDTHYYVGGQWPSGTMIDAGKADQPSEVGVSSACGTTLAKHRFRYKVRQFRLKADYGKSVWVYGQLLSMGVNALVPNSGNVSLPSIPYKGYVKGNVEGVFLRSGVQTLEGWTCAWGINESAVIHIYAGAPYPDGTMIGSATANKASEAAVSSSCNTTLAKHRFTFALSESQLSQYAGQSLYVRALIDASEVSGLVPGSVVMPQPIPNVPPTVSLTSPANGASYTAPATITLAATASDSDGTIAKVEFYNGTTLLETDTIAPYSYNWTNVPAGNYSLKARAYDNAGAAKDSTSSAVTVSYVKGNVEGLFLRSGVQTLEGWTCAWGINESAVIHIYAGAPYPGGTKIGSATANKASEAAVSSSCNTTLAKHRFAFALSESQLSEYAGQRLYVRALIDASEVSGLVPGSVVMPQPIPNVPPTVSLTSPANGATYTATQSILLKATASDSDGSIIRVQFYDGSTQIGEDVLSAPYELDWINAPVGTHTLTAKAYDNIGAVKVSSPITITVTQASALNCPAPLGWNHF